MAIVLGAAGLFTVPARAQIVTVDSTADDADNNPGDGTCNTALGECTLRAAIMEANAGPVDTIHFNIPGPGPHTITPAADLPAITSAVSIVGETEPGSVVNSAAIGNNSVHQIIIGGAFSMLDIKGSGTSTVSGLVIYDASGNRLIRIGIDASSPTVNIRGCFLGTDETGMVGISSGGILVNEGLAFIGTADPADRNVLGGIIRTGLGGNGRVIVLNNYIGINAAGNASLGTASVGVWLITSDNRVGDLDAGNVIAGCSSTALVIGFLQVDVDRNEVFSNIIGLDATGTFAVPNGRGIIVTGDQVNDTTIGGSSDHANVVAGNIAEGILIQDTHNTLVSTNWIGTNSTFAPGLANGSHAIVINSINSPLQDNFIDANMIRAAGTMRGIDLSFATGVQVTDNLVRDALIGIHLEDCTDTLIDGNGVINNDTGVLLRDTTTGTELYSNFINNNVVGVFLTDGAWGNTIGEPAFPNTITLNGIDGVLLDETASIYNIIASHIYDNGGLGINLRPAGEPPSTVTPNDPLDPDTGPNLLHNYPELFTAFKVGDTLIIEGVVDGEPGGIQKVRFYHSSACDSSGYGEGEEYLGETVAASGVPFTANLTVGVVMPYLTATAEDVSFISGTSEFSACIPIIEAPLQFVVNSTADDADTDPGDGACNTALGECTLRAAIMETNASPVDTIHFNIPGAGPHTITPATGLPAITSAVNIVGETQPGSVVNSAAVGNNSVHQIIIGGFFAAFDIGGGGTSTISGLVINDPDMSFSWSIQVGFDGSAPTVNVRGCFLGTDETGMVGVSNTGIGAFTGTTYVGTADPAHRNVIAGRITSFGNGQVVVLNNYIGINAAGNASLAIADVGVHLFTSDNQIGAAGAGNVIAGCAEHGVLIGSVGSALDADANQVYANIIGLDATGTFAVPNDIGVRVAVDAIGIYSGTVIGGPGPDANTIAGNTSYGILIEDTDNTQIVGNWIGISETGGPIPNGGHAIAITRVNNPPSNMTIASNFIHGTSAANCIDADGAAGIIIADNFIEDADVGVHLTGSTTGTVLRINTIIDHVFGVILSGGASGNTIGDPAWLKEPSVLNTIALNVFDGVLLDETAGSNNVIASNIYGNGGLGINLRPAGEPPSTVTPNDPDDLDNGPNGLQNYPVLLWATKNGSDLTITGQVDSAGADTFLVRLYQNSVCDASGFGEGEVYLGETTAVLGSARGTSLPEFSVVLTDLGAGTFITATAEAIAAPAGTSEFSACIEVWDVTPVIYPRVMEIPDTGGASVSLVLGLIFRADDSVVAVGSVGVGPLVIEMPAVMKKDPNPYLPQPWSFTELPVLDTLLGGRAVAVQAKDPQPMIIVGQVGDAAAIGGTQPAAWIEETDPPAFPLTVLPTEGGSGGAADWVKEKNPEPYIAGGTAHRPSLSLTATFATLWEFTAARGGGSWMETYLPQLVPELNGRGRQGEYPPALTVQVNDPVNDNSDADPIAANGSELDAARAVIREGNLYLLLTGNLDSAFGANIELFFDTGPGGQAELLGPENPDVDFQALQRMGVPAGGGTGLRFETGFDADYWIGLTLGDGGGGIQIFGNYAELPAGGGGAGYWLGSAAPDGDGLLTGGVQNPFGIRANFDNSNTAGLPASDPAAVPTGLEVIIPLAALGSPSGSFDLLAFINADDHSSIGTQVLPPLPAASGPLGDPRAVDFATIAGTQAMTLSPTSPAEVSIVHGYAEEALGDAMAVGESRDFDGNAVGVVWENFTGGWTPPRPLPLPAGAVSGVGLDVVYDDVAATFTLLGRHTDGLGTTRGLVWEGLLIDTPTDQYPASIELVPPDGFDNTWPEELVGQPNPDPFLPAVAAAVGWGDGGAAGQQGLLWEKDPDPYLPQVAADTLAPGAPAGISQLFGGTLLDNGQMLLGGVGGLGLRGLTGGQAIVTTDVCPGDPDCDDTTQGLELAQSGPCLTGPDASYYEVSGCNPVVTATFDFDEDGDYDLPDYAQWMRDAQ